jgi:pimeloyl-ACP methyl ester carboxylesterase
MSTFVLIHGGGSSAWDWHLVAPELQAHGHDVVAVDLPTEEPGATWSDMADFVAEAIGDRTDLVIVGHSFGGFTATLVAARVNADALILVSGMIPVPGEPAGDWWQTSGHDAAWRASGHSDDDETAMFLQDVEPELAAEALRRSRATESPSMREPWPLDALPAVPTRYVLARDDRFLPAEWLRGYVRERLGIEADEIDGGHCLYLSRPKELAASLQALASAEAASSTRKGSMGVR